MQDGTNTVGDGWSPPEWGFRTPPHALVVCMWNWASIEFDIPLSRRMLVYVKSSRLFPRLTRSPIVVLYQYGGGGFKQKMSTSRFSLHDLHFCAAGPRLAID